MATLHRLIGDGRLVRIEVELGPRQLVWRNLFGLPDFVKWLDEVLPDLQSGSIGCEITPLEQVDALFAEFIAGQPLGYGRQFRCLRPAQKAVWELKTIDIRIFGWFLSRDHFVAVFGDHADRVKDHNLYGGYRDEVVRLREAIELDGRKYLDGTEVEDVVSVADKGKK